MLMVPELRRITILLDAIPKDAKIGIHAPEGHVRLWVFHRELRVLDNVFVVEQREAPGRNYTTYLPIDEIRSVWKQSDGEWRMIVKGDMRDTGGEFFYQTAIPSR